MQDNVSIKFRNVYKPVDIILPFHEHYHLLLECLESLIAKTLGITYTITIVDDCSKNKSFIDNLIKKKKLPIQYLRHDKQLGFGASLKTGFDNTQNDWVVFLHSDCRVEKPDWLINMQESMANHKKDGIKLVSAKVNDGGTGTYDTSIIGTAEKTKDIIAQEPLPLICTLAHRELFNKIGFVKSYPYFHYEDLELFWRMKKYDYKQLICGSAYVFHHGGLIVKDLLKNHLIRKEVEENKNRFVKEIRTLYGK